MKTGFTSQKDLTVSKNRIIDETAGEVNVSYIPRNAIIGWVTVSTMHMDGNNGNNSRLDTLQRRISMDKDYTIQFNPEYTA